MKYIGFLIFVVIILSIHGLVNYYIYARGSQALESVLWVKPYFKWSMLFFTLAYPISRLLEKVWLSPISDVLHWAGALWFAVMLYGFLVVVFVDVIRLADFIFSFLPSLGSEAYLRLKFYAFLGGSAVVVLIVLFGFLNAWHPKVTYKELIVDKSAGGLESLRIVAASDVHMGTIIAKRKVGKLVNEINSLNPDVILFAGDVVDEDVQPVIRQNLGVSLQKLKAPLGVYAITGNHEYIGGVESASNYLNSNGLTMLRDTAILVNSSFYIVGREDKDMSRFTAKKRKSIDSLLENIDLNYPVVMLDHQPFNLDEVANTGVDLQISGHTHHGQLWPFGYVTQQIFELSRGYLQKGNTHFYVSTGFGTWGPPVRTGNRPEIMVFDLKFKR